MIVGGQHQAPAALPQEKNPGAHYTVVGGLQGRSGPVLRI